MAEASTSESVRSKDLYGGRYRVFSDGRLMNVATGEFIGRAKNDIMMVSMHREKGGSKLLTQLKKVVYEEFVGPLKPRTVLLHRNGNWRDCSVGNIYQKRGGDAQVVDANRHKYPAPEYAFAPAPYSRYVAKRTGELFNAMTGAELEGSMGGQGMVMVPISNDDGNEKPTNMTKSRFVYACFHPEFNLGDKKSFVIRIDGDINNNDVSNFKAGTPADMLKNTRDLDPTIAQRAGATRARTIEVVNADGAVIRTYDGTLIAAKDLGMGHLALQTLVNSGQAVDGLVYRRQFPELDVPEAWYKILPRALPDWASESIRNLEGTYVSDAGRVVSEQGYLYVDEPKRKTCYRMFQGRFYHVVICYAFHGPPPDAEHTPDHLNRDRLDNRAVNLRWATRIEQGTNMSVAVGIIKTSVETGEATEYPSKGEASRASGVSIRRITDACVSGQACQGFTWKETSTAAYEETDGPVLGHPEVAKPVDYDFVRRLVQRNTSDT